MTTCSQTTATAAGPEIDLSRATVVADRADHWGYHVAAQGSNPDVILDGDEATAWSSGATDLDVMPTNIMIIFPEPIAIGAMQVGTVVSKKFLRLTDVEVYAQVADGWARLATIRGNEKTTIECDLAPAKVQTVRLRVRGSARLDNAWAVIHTVRFFSPAAGVELTPLAPMEVPDETPNERCFLREALDLRGREPYVTYDPEIGYLGYVTSFLDTMIEEGTDRYGDVHSPVFVGMLEIDTHQHPGGYIPSIPGQRMGDRPFWGANLVHDRPLLEAMTYVSDYAGKTKYRDAARAYLEFYLKNCTDTPTGLWPWGEHVYWDFYRDQHSTDRLEHETQGMSPFGFWETAWEIAPDAVLGEASGLINHVFDLDTFAFNRHADITRVLPDPRPAGLKGLDFQVHGARYLRMWAFAWSKSHEDTYYGWIERMADYWEDCRLKDSGMLPVLSKYAWRPALRPTVDGTLSAGIAMLEAAELLEETELAKKLRRQGTTYVELVAAHDSPLPEKVGFDTGYGGVSILNRQIHDRPVTGFVGNATRMFAYRMTGDKRHLQTAREIAEAYAAIEEVPDYDHLRAEVFGQLIHMMLDMYEFDPAPCWLTAAEKFGRTGIERFYSNGLFRGATNQWIYDSQLGPGSLVHGLVRLHAITEQEETPAPALYYHR